jgi:hypothetical protein
MLADQGLMRFGGRLGIRVSKNSSPNPIGFFRIAVMRFFLFADPSQK